MELDGEDEELRQSLDSAPLLRLLVLAGHVTAQRWGRVTQAQHGLTTAGVNTLLLVARGAGGEPATDASGRLTHADLARKLWVRPATLTGVVDTLVKAGYLARERDETDRRKVWLVLTDEGRARVGEIRKDVREILAVPMVHPDPAAAAVIRAFLVDLIMTYHEEPTDE